MPQLPHNFPSLRNVGAGPHRPPIIVIGAGLSADLAPLPALLLAEMRHHAEVSVGCITDAAATDLYRWADDIIRQLIARGDQNPKLTLARALKIQADARWGATAAVSRSQPRHRVIARFAREGLLHELWSLNWDCWQENALENVGLKRGEADTSLPWRTRFDTFITPEDCHDMGVAGTFAVVKPHGCVTALIRADVAVRQGRFADAKTLADRFLITSTELQAIRPIAGQPAEQFIFSRLCNELAARPLIVAGWSVSERYLIEYVRANIAPLVAVNAMATDEISVISLSFNDQGHAELASFYGKTAASAHIAVEIEPGFTTDRLFLWLQALYGVTCLQTNADPALPQLQEIVNRLAQPTNVADFAIEFIDEFLPVWVRLCWRCESVECYKDGVQVPADAIRLESRDEHIPWNLPRIRRPDLAAAARLLDALEASNPAGWNYRMFPGGFYDSEDQLLVIPLPAWNMRNLNDLRGLKVLIDSVRERGIGFIDKVAILPLAVTGQEPVGQQTIDTCKRLLAQQFPIARFAQSGNIECTQLIDL